MPDYMVRDIEKVKDMDYKGEPATILMLTLEEPNGESKQAEMFTTSKTPLPTVGQSVTGDLQDSQYGLKFRPARTGGGPRGRSPADTKAIQRQHSQEMALRREANLGAKWTGEQLRSVINWFEQDIATKDRATSWDGLTDDVSADMSGTPFEEDNPHA